MLIAETVLKRASVWFAALSLVGASVVHAAGFKVYQIHADHLGTPRALTDKNGRVVWKGDGAPYGMVDRRAGDADPMIRFPGQYFEKESGLHYNLNRFFDSRTGRYLRPDPIGLGAGPNLFGYAGGNPITNSDPTGLVTWTGAMVGTQATYIFGAGVFRFRLTSECVDGKRATARILAVGPVTGIGLLIGIDVGTLVLEDGLAELDPFVLEGMMGYTSVTASAVFGVGAYVVGLGGDGSHTSDKAMGADAGWTLGIGLGASSLIGSSTITSLVYENCDCE